MAVSPTDAARSEAAAEPCFGSEAHDPGLLELVLRGADTGFIVIDENRDILMYNHRATELGLINGDLAEPVAAAVTEAFRSGAETEFDFTPPRSSSGFVSTGRTLTRPPESVHCAIRSMLYGDRRIAIVYGTDDSTNLRVQAARRDFVANVSHELKTPVGAVSLLAEALLQSKGDPDAVEHFGNKVLREAERMGNLVTELIALSQLQDGGSVGDFREVDVDDLVEEATAAAKISADAASIELNADRNTGLTVRGDRILLLTALNNLLSNAIAYSPTHTSVSISRRRTTLDSGAPAVAIAVTDRGIGIAKADQSRLFERFFRVDQARSRMTGGTGLGLAIVKHVVANHGGEIGLWSQPGTGSTFTLFLPAGPDGQPTDGTAVGQSHPIESKETPR